MNTNDSVQDNPGRTAGEAGWRISRYNLYAEIPGTAMIAVANLFKGMCSEFTPLEMDLLSVVEMLDENHPLIDRFARRGAIVNFDERAALEVMGRVACALPHVVGLSICPTLGCNFDCPYCFQDHLAGKMTPEVQDDVVSLAERMMEAATVKDIDVTRHLRGGSPTFERIAGNLRDTRIPFKVDVRHNVYAGNCDEVDALDSFVKQLSEESGNDLYCYHTPVAGSPSADARGRQVDLLCGGDISDFRLCPGNAWAQ